MLDAVVDSVRDGYAKTIRPYHSWLLRKTFDLVSSQLPTSEEMVVLMGPGLGDAEREGGWTAAGWIESLGLHDDVAATLAPLLPSTSRPVGSLRASTWPCSRTCSRRHCSARSCMARASPYTLTAPVSRMALARELAQHGRDHIVVPP